MDRYAVRRASRVIAVNASRAAIMHAELGGTLPVVIPNLPLARDPSTLPRREHSPLRKFAARTLGVAEAELPPLLLYQGVMTGDRNLDCVVRALGLTRTPVVLVLLGFRGPPVDQLLTLARETGVAPRVLYHPGVDSDELPAYTAGADAGLVIYAREPRNNYLCAPNKLFEYCMAGVPVLGCDFPEVTRVLRAHAAGEWFDPDEPRQIAAAIDRLLGDPARLAAARTETRAVRERYHWGIAKVALEGLYAELLGAP
jgi:glycosyltransferase involved in cell wall biosynthesis